MNKMSILGWVGLMAVGLALPVQAEELARWN